MAEYHQQQQQNFPPQQPGQPYQSPPVMGEKGQLPAQGAAPVHNHSHGHSHGGKWAFGFWDCFKPFDLCCWTFWCPCVVFGRTYERNKTGEKSPDGLGGMCCLWLLTAYCGCSSCLQCVTRSNYREKVGIEGNTGLDFLSACCCPCCALMQEEKESLVRTTGINPVTKAVYQPVAPMTV